MSQKRALDDDGNAESSQPPARRVVTEEDAAAEFYNPTAMAPFKFGPYRENPQWIENKQLEQIDTHHRRADAIAWQRSVVLGTVMRKFLDNYHAAAQQSERYMQLLTLTLSDYTLPVTADSSGSGDVLVARKHLKRTANLCGSAAAVVDWMLRLKVPVHIELLAPDSDAPKGYNIYQGANESAPRGTECNVGLLYAMRPPAVSPPTAIICESTM